MKARGEMLPAEPKIEAFLSDLAVRGKVAVSTQNQAFNALLFLYRTKGSNHNFATFKLGVAKLWFDPNGT